jgi:hypothetical protein
MVCEISAKYVIVILLVILLIYNWRDAIADVVFRRWLGFSSDPVEMMKDVPQYVGHGRPPGSGGGPLSIRQRQSGGIAGVTETISLDSMGGWVKSAEGGYTDKGKLPADLARKVMANAEKMEPSANAGNCVDCFRYEVWMTYPSTQVVHKILDKSVFPTSLGF